MNQAISVILPNYNGRKLLEKNIPSLLEALDGIDNEIIVVDDCSSDDSVQFLQETYPEIKIICNEENIGFSATCNKGIKAARLDLLCIVNTDVTFTPDYFTNMNNEFDDPSLFAIKGNIVNYDNTFDDVINIDRTGLLYYKRGFLRISAKAPLTSKTLINSNDNDFVCLGCCFVCNRKMMLQLKGFDEIYSPFYWEDIDIARRAMKQGYKLLYLPDSIVYHQSSSTIATYRSNNLRRLISIRNKFIFTWRHLDASKLICSHIPLTIINILTRWIILDWRYYTCFFWALSRKLTFN